MYEKGDEVRVCVFSEASDTYLSLKVASMKLPSRIEEGMISAFLHKVVACIEVVVGVVYPCLHLHSCVSGKGLEVFRESHKSVCASSVWL